MKAEFKNNYIKIGLKISYYRKLKSLTQEQLAEILGCGVSFIGQIEAPNIYKAISLDTLFRIAKALEIPPHKLLYFEED
ncbi:MAG: helix-turn-helix transcriptional regulator [Ruminococcaceae bacterium]|nr:helix-turn-helix transcriptional regulator [Oscillospiraceae bacterium]